MMCALGSPARERGTWAVGRCSKGRHVTPPAHPDPALSRGASEGGH